MAKREAEFQTLFRHWLRANPMQSAAFELKQTRTDSLAFSAVEPHQVLALQTAKGRGILYKIPDDSRGIKPFDMVYLRSASAFVVIRFPRCFCIIDVDVFEKESRISERKSLTVERAKSIAHRTVDLR